MSCDHDFGNADIKIREKLFNDLVTSAEVISKVLGERGKILEEVAAHPPCNEECHVSQEAKAKLKEALGMIVNEVKGEVPQEATPETIH